jgi:hypothetical protein
MRGDEGGAAREYMLRRLKPLGPHVTRTYRKPTAAATATASGLGSGARAAMSQGRMRRRAMGGGACSGGRDACSGAGGCSEGAVREARRKQHDGRTRMRECTDGEADALARCSWGRDNYLSGYQPCSERKGGARVAEASGRDEGARVMCGIRRWRAVIGGRPGRTSAFRNEVEEMGGPLFIKAPTYRRLPSVPSPEPALVTSRERFHPRPASTCALTSAAALHSTCQSTQQTAPAAYHSPLALRPPSHAVAGRGAEGHFSPPAHPCRLALARCST